MKPSEGVQLAGRAGEALKAAGSEIQRFAPEKTASLNSVAMAQQR